MGEAFIEETRNMGTGRGWSYTARCPRCRAELARGTELNVPGIRYLRVAAREAYGRHACEEEG